MYMPLEFHTGLAPEKSWLKNDPFLLGPLNCSLAFPVNLRGRISKIYTNNIFSTGPWKGVPDSHIGRYKCTEISRNYTVSFTTMCRF